MMYLLAQIPAEAWGEIAKLGAVGLLALAIVVLFRGGATIITRFLDILDRLTIAIEKIESSESKQTVAIADVVITNREVVGVTKESRDSTLGLLEEIRLNRKSQNDHQTAIIETIAEAKGSIESSIKEIDSRSMLETIAKQLRELEATVQKAIANCKGVAASE